MVEGSDDIAVERNKVLEELHQILVDPLLTKLDDQDSAERFLRDNPAGKKGPILLGSVANVEDETVLGKIIKENVSKGLVGHGKRSELGESRSGSSIKRKGEFLREEREAKFAKLNNSRKGSGGRNRVPKSTLEVTRPASLIPPPDTKYNVQLEQTQFMVQQDISDLEVLAVPDSYPTQVHNVSSLAELYYLTQTLPLIKLIPGCHKTLITENFELALLEGKIAVLYSRIEELKRQGKWSLKQPLRYFDPFLYQKKTQRKKFQYDALVEEGKWMAIDFKESTKFKKACCVEIAKAVNDYWTYGKVMCVKRKPIVHLDELQKILGAEKKEGEASNNDNNESVPVEQVESKDNTTEMNENQETVKVEDGETSPEIEESAGEKPEDIGDAPDIESHSDKETLDVLEDTNDTIDVLLLLGRPKPEEEITPPQLPSYTEQELRQSDYEPSPFKLHVDLNDLQKIDQSVIRNLPKFTAFDDEDREGHHAPPAPLKPQESPMIPVSRLLYNFQDDEDWYKIVLKEGEYRGKGSTQLPEFQKGLFGLQSHRRFNYLKPPKPPLIKNIEFRSPTIWLPEDDKYLIHYVAEFCFNWELISAHLLTRASTLKRYESNIERRTPWQCFERYIQLNEKFQFSDMRGVYAYHAQQWLEQAHKAQLTTKRRISPLGVGNESIQRGHRRLRWASLFDAMRKCMKKRENAIAKMNQKKASHETNASTNGSAVSETGSNTSSSESSLKRGSDKIPSPAELSKLKFERDKSIQEAYMNQQATRSRMMAAVAQQQKQQQNQPNVAGANKLQIANTSPLNRPKLPQGSPSASAVPANKAYQIQDPKARHASLQPQGQPGQGGQVGGSIKRPTTPNGTPYTNEQIQQLLQIQKQRRLMQQQQQQQQQQQGQFFKQGINPSQSTLSMSQNQVSGSSKPGVDNNNLASGANQSPQVPAAQKSQPAQQQQVPQQRQQVPFAQQPDGSRAVNNKARIHFAPAQVSAIINSIQTKNPNLSKEQVTKLAATYLANLQQQQQNRINQQQTQQPTQQPAQQQTSAAQFLQSLQAQGRLGQGLQTGVNQKQSQFANLTPQERNQLQMLKAAKTVQQQQQQIQQQQLQQQIQQQRKMLNAQFSENSNMSKMEIEQRKKLLLQKQQQLRNKQLQQGQIGTGINQRTPQQMSNVPISGAASPALSSVSSASSSPVNTQIPNLHLGNNNNSGDKLGGSSRDTPTNE